MEVKKKEKGAAGLPLPPEGEKKESPADGRTNGVNDTARRDASRRKTFERVFRQFRAALKRRFIRLKSAPGTARTSRARSQWRPKGADG